MDEDDDVSILVLIYCIIIDFWQAFIIGEEWYKLYVVSRTIDIFQLFHNTERRQLRAVLFLC